MYAIWSQVWMIQRKDFSRFYVTLQCKARTMQEADKKLWLTVATKWSQGNGFEPFAAPVKVG